MRGNEWEVYHISHESWQPVTTWQGKTLPSTQATGGRKPPLRGGAESDLSRAQSAETRENDCVTTPRSSDTKLPGVVIITAALILP